MTFDAPLDDDAPTKLEQDNEKDDVGSFIETDDSDKIDFYERDPDFGPIDGEDD